MNPPADPPDPSAGSSTGSADGPVRFPPELPISARVRDIASAIADHQVVIVAGETGSGKTTQLPKICLAMGRGLVQHIGVTEPRRIAATSVAARVAKELNVELGKEVGYQIRFANRTSRDTYVKFMTDGILLAEIQGDPMLSAYDTLILDEAHERSLNVDFLLGYVKRLLPKRPDLRVIVSSATLELDRFSAFFERAPVIQVSGRTYPVDVIHRPPLQTEGDLAETVAAVVDEITELDPREDVLVFLPGEREIREAMDALTARALPHTVLLPLYGRLSQADQAKVFQSMPERRVVLATNVAETSLTIPGIVYVVDSGLARMNRYSARTGVTQLLIESISRASADQRKGRAGRTNRGVCFRLYEAQDDALRAPYTDPEVLRVGLAGAILQMKALGLGPIEAFPFLDPPPKRAVDEGYRVLEEIGALDAAGALTEIGKQLARLPVDPRIGRMILAGEKEGALREVLIIAAALGIQDPRERPLAVQRQADEAHRRFRDEASDFATLLKIWAFYQDALEKRSQNQVKKVCRDAFLSYVRMREWSDIHQQLSRIARELRLSENGSPANGEAVHRAVLPGLLSRVGMWHQEQRVYMGARQTRFMLHPSSGLAKKAPAWVVAAELVETSQLFARTAAKIEPTWLEAAGGPLCKKNYGEPHWAERTAEVRAKENVTLYGLPIVRDRSVHYGPIDPKSSRKIFIHHALVKQEYTQKARFIDHNRALFDEVRLLRDKARRSDMLADDDAVARFFEAKIPDDVYSGKTFERWRKEAEEKDPEVLFLSLHDVLTGEEADLSPERFPESIEVSGARLPLSYRFDPGEDDDGVTVTLPVALLPAVDPGLFDHIIPGWHVEKIRSLLDSLPKALRKVTGAARELAPDLARAIPPFSEPLLPALSRELHGLSGVRIPVGAFQANELPPYLSLSFRVVSGDRVLAVGRDVRELAERFGAVAREAWGRLAKLAWEREGLTSWSFDALPERVMVEIDGTKMFAYPALVDRESSVSLSAKPSRAAAEVATRAGLRRLFLLQMGSGIQKIEAQISSKVAASSLSDAGGAPRRRIALRALDEAFMLEDPARIPRTRAAFMERLDVGKRRVGDILSELSTLAVDIAVELDKARSMLRALAGKPGAPRASLDDVRAQIDHLASPDLLISAPRDRLSQVPRYLKAIQVRLDRLPNGPQKDQSKSGEVLPFWSNWLTHRDALKARGVPEGDIDSFRWLVEELRVSVFAPELRTRVTVSPQRLTEQWKALIG